jgi:hypothetical protein
MKESVILCEGYHDRSFWAALLEQLKCVDPGKRPRKESRLTIKDPRGLPVTGGQYAFSSKTEKFIRIVPCGGDKAKVLKEARARLQDDFILFHDNPSGMRLSRLIMNIDSDVNADGSSSKTVFRRQDLLPILKEYDSDATESEHGDVALFNNALFVSLIHWETKEPVTQGIPNQETLERLVCSAILVAYPDRGFAVQQWLDSRLNPPKPNPKEYAWSYMAGWHAEFGSESFYRKIWLDEKIARELKSRLTACGAWRVGEALAE